MANYVSRASKNGMDYKKVNNLLHSVPSFQEQKPSFSEKKTAAYQVPTQVFLSSNNS